LCKVLTSFCAMARLLNTKANINGSKLKSRGKLREYHTHKYWSTATSGAGMQHGSHINISLQKFFPQTNHAEKFMREMLCRDRYLQR
jgi:hypothetical protein